jgi:DmsE family decaheme c-type cytochrome
MQSLRKLLAFSVLAVFLTGFTFAIAADGPPKAVDRTLAGDAVCTKCHDETWPKPILSIYQTPHGTKADERTPGCQTCHGASEGHLKNPGTEPDMVFETKSKDAIPAEAQNAVCMTCHQKDSKRSHWAGSAHDTKGVSCASCHEVHNSHDKVRDKRTQFEVCFTCHKDKRAEVNRPSHHPVLEGKVACSDCHNPHGSAGTSNLKRDNVRDTCFQCHAEKRGPFVHNHQPATEACTICHNPHGTVVESMLKVRPPFLCHQCHTPHGGFIPQIIGAQVTGNKPTTANGLGKGNTNVNQGRGCLNCHTEVHGSNNPSATNPTPQFMLR